MSASSGENFTHVHMEVNVTSLSHTRMNHAKSSLLLFVASTLISTCVCVLNPLTIVTILKTASLRRCHSNIFLINLAVVDLLFMLLVMTFITTIWLGTGHWVMCIVAIVYLGTVSSASMLFCFAIAVDRFLFIHKALTYSAIVTHNRVLKVAACIWIACFVNGLTPIMDGKVIMNRCSNAASVGMSVQSFTVLTMYCVTAVISVCLYTKLFFVIREHNKLLQSHALAHCRAHTCSSQACRVRTTLGECRFRHDNLSSVTWSTGGCHANDEQIENKRLISNHRVHSSASSMTSGIRTASSDLFTHEQDFSSSLVEQPTGKTARAGRQHTISQERNDSKHSKDNALVEARPVTQKNKRFGQCQHLRDLRTIKALMMMFVIYFICWAPMIALKFWHVICNKQVGERWMNAAWICAMSNSVWNFLVYPLRKKDFRDAMIKMVRRCVGLQVDHTRPRSLPTEGGSDSVQSSLKKSSSCALRLS